MTWSIRGKNVLVTGGSSGIGRAAATELAAQGALVTITSRDTSRAKEAAEQIGQVTGASVRADVVDLADFVSTRSFGERFVSRTSSLDILINNAGGIFGSRRESTNGHEMTFATNHLGPFLLTSLLMVTLQNAEVARIINVSSVAHTYATDGILFDDLGWQDRKYKMMDVYGHSKLANILHAQGINDRYGPTISAYAMHPGVVATSFGGRGGSTLVRLAGVFGKRWMRTVSEGADTIVWLATTQSIDASSGIYFSDRAQHKTTRWATDEAQSDRLWQASVDLTDAEA